MRIQNISRDCVQFGDEFNPPEPVH
jgi:hypothetical protein